MDWILNSKKIFNYYNFTSYITDFSWKKSRLFVPSIYFVAVLATIQNINFTFNLRKILPIFILTLAIGAIIGNVRVDKDASFNIIKDNQAGEVFQLYTANQIIGTFYAVSHNIKVGEFEHLNGQSYIDWLKRIPPGFLGIDRPEELASQMKIGEQVMAQGGIYELSEAYWNFGIIGTFIIPFLVSFLIGRYIILKDLNL